MARWQILLLCCLLASTAFVQNVRCEEGSGDAEDDEDYADAERAFLIVRKHVKDTVGVQGRNFTVYMDVYNAGSVTAKEVTIKDVDLPAGLSLVEGKLSASFDKVEQGATVSFSYVVSADQGQRGYELDPATVSYISEIDSTDKQAAQSSSAFIYVMTPTEKIQKHALDLGRYASLGFAQSGADWRNMIITIAVIGGLVGSNSMVKTYKTSRSAAQRKKALASLEKDQ